ncbi:MAG: A/G-specific adenine glycosylase [Thermodesulfobacteriota bacterium]
MKSLHHKERIQSKLLQWYKENGRDLPWRKTRDPYAIWVSEIMLQQTRVDTAIPYYQRFLRTFPTLQHLARAKLSRVLKIWEGLGYYARARNLHRASKIVVAHFQGKIPDHRRDLLSLPGIGRSTAGAILSLAYDQEAPILDGNVKRVLSRLAAVSDRSVSQKSGSLLWKISESLLPKNRSNPFNQALMDLGSLLCTLKDPQCPRCPLQDFCEGKASGDPEKYPGKTLKKPIPHTEAMAAVIRRDGKVLIKQRPLHGLLGGLWEFPNWEVEEIGRSRLRLRLRNYIKRDMRMDVQVGDPIGTFKQTFSHFKLTLRVIHCEFVTGNATGKWVLLRDLGKFPMSRIHRKIAEKIA